MNYNIPWVAKKVEAYLKHRLEHERDVEVPFSSIENMVRHLAEVDRTPQWVIVAAVGYLMGQNCAGMRVWKRDQSAVDEVKVSWRRPQEPGFAPVPDPEPAPARKSRKAAPRAKTPRKRPARS